MKELTRGMRERLEGHVSLDRPVTIEMHTAGSAVYDHVCFGTDAAGRLADDRCMVFYNQPATPDRAITLTQSADGAVFQVDLNRLPVTIARLVFTVCIDGEGTMGEIRSHVLQLKQDGSTALELSTDASAFQREKAIISVEIYRKDGWRIAAVARGFNGGLGDLLRSFGGEEVSAPAPAPSPAPAPVPAAPVPAPPVSVPPSAPGKISLEKKLEREAPGLISLAKPLTVVLEKKNLQDCAARVALVMDISGSMSRRYKNGTVQAVIDKTLPLAVQFDDDGELDFWYYGSTPGRMPAVSLRNYKTAVPEDWRKLMQHLGGRNNEPLVMQEVLDTYRSSRLPVYVLFITDGGVSSESRIRKILVEASRLPIFWQFVGVGGSGYGILTRLDTMEGRFVDNAGFFALDDFKSVPDAQLYDRLLGEFPVWLRNIRQLGMI